MSHSSLRELVERPLEFLSECREELGDVFTLRLGTTDMTMVGHPDFALHVLRTHKDQYNLKGDGGGFQTAVVPLLADGFATRPDAGPDWLRQRKLVTQKFRRADVLGSVDAMVTAVAQSLDRWEQSMREGRPVDLGIELPRLAMSAIAEIAVGVTISVADSDRLIQALQRVVDYVWEGLYFGDQRGGSRPAWLTGPGREEYREAIAVVHETVRAICEEAEAERGWAHGRTGILDAFVSQRKPGGSSAEDMRDVVATVLVAGYESLQALLAFAFHYLCDRRACMAKLETEIARTVGRRAPRREDVPRLRYTDAVLMETLRMSSPIYWIQREASAPDVLGGYRVERGAKVAVMTHLIHHHPEFWPDPETFDPDRFLFDGSADRHPFAWMPFGIGDRKCFAQQFSMVQGAIVLAMVFQRFTLSPIGGLGRVQATTNLRLVGEVPVMLKPRGSEGTAADV